MNIPSVQAAKITRLIDISKITNIVIPVLAIILSVAINIFLVWPKFRDTLSLRESNQELNTRVDALKTKAQFLSSLNRATLSDQLASAEGLLPSGKNAFTFIRQVELAASTTGIILNKVDVAPGLVSEGEVQTAPAGGPPSASAPGSTAGQTFSSVPKVSLKIAITSDYKSFLAFLANLYGNPRVAIVRDLAIGAASAGAESAPLKSTMVIESFYKQLPQKLGSIESPVVDLTQGEKDRLAKIKTVLISPTTPSQVVTVPEVPIGREDLFAPF